MRRTILLLVCLAVPYRAAPPASARGAGLQVDLRLAEGTEVVAALRFRMEPGWHLYWKNPGDSGLPPEVTWTLPPGWTAGPLEHPVPEALPSPEGLDYGHSGSFTLLARLNPPPGPRTARILRAHLDWLACKDSCLPGKADLSARPGDPATLLSPAERDSMLASLPRKVPLETGPITVRRSGARWLIEVPLRGPEAAQAVAFFPEALPGFSIVHREIRLEGPVLRIPVLPSGPGAELAVLRGVLSLGGQGLALELRLPRAPAL